MECGQKKLHESKLAWNFRSILLFIRFAAMCIKCPPKKKTASEMRKLSDEKERQRKTSVLDN